MASSIVAAAGSRRLRRFAWLALGPALGACAFSVPIRPSIEGSRWQVTRINGTELPRTDQYQVTFERGRIGGRLGCNHFGAPYVLGPTHLEIGPASATRKLCGEQEMAHESAGFAAIRQPLKIFWTDLGSRLVLTSPGGSLDLKRVG